MLRPESESVYLWSKNQHVFWAFMWTTKENDDFKTFYDWMQGDYCESYFAGFLGTQIAFGTVHSSVWNLQQHAKMKSAQYFICLFERNLFISLW